jgi:hypothetical protein
VVYSFVPYRREPSANFIAKVGLKKLDLWIRICISKPDSDSGRQKMAHKRGQLRHYYYVLRGLGRILLYFVLEIIVLINPEFVSGFGLRIKPLSDPAGFYLCMNVHGNLLLLRNRHHTLPS